MNTAAISLVGILVAITIGLSIFSQRFTRTTTDFYLAGRKVGAFTNASAISGDYLSAASFLGVGAAVYASGLDGVWYAAGFAGGFMVVVLFIASALRRFGEYTVADFAYGRFGSNRVRLVSVLCVLMVSLFYMAPQMYGAGNTWKILVGRSFLPSNAEGMFLGVNSTYLSGVTVVAAIMMFYVAMGGMKGTTLNQVIQFWWLWLAMFLVVAFAFGQGFNYPNDLKAASESQLLNASSLTVDALQTPDPATSITPLEKAEGVMTPEGFAKAEAEIEAAVAAGDTTVKVAVLQPAPNKLHEVKLLFNEPGHRYNALDQFSMVLALVLGTAGLPHILNRYYTNPSGRAARRSTFWVLVFIGTFYIMAPMAGLFGRLEVFKQFFAGTAPSNATYVDGYLTTPSQLMPALGQMLGGQGLMGIVAAGAFAAMFSTVGGLLIASASAIGHDVYEKYVNPNASQRRRVYVGKIAVIVFASLGWLLGWGIPASGLPNAYPALIAMMVTWAFAVGASCFVPMLLTGIWWKGTTERGAITGMLIGLISAVGIIFLNILRQTGVIGSEGALGFITSLTFPVVFTFPAALLAIIIVSKADGKLPDNVDAIWLRIHGTASERHEKQHGLDKVGRLLRK